MFDPKRGCPDEALKLAYLHKVAQEVVSKENAFKLEQHMTSCKQCLNWLASEQSFDQNLRCNIQKVQVPATTLQHIQDEIRNRDIVVLVPQVFLKIFTMLSVLLSMFAVISVGVIFSTIGNFATVLLASVKVLTFVVDMFEVGVLYIQSLLQTEMFQIHPQALLATFIVGVASISFSAITISVLVKFNMQKGVLQ